MCQTLVLEHCSAALTISSAFFRVNLLSPTKSAIMLLVSNYNKFRERQYRKDRAEKTEKTTEMSSEISDLDLINSILH
jgi:hypothetical protein